MYCPACPAGQLREWWGKKIPLAHVALDPNRAVAGGGRGKAHSEVFTPRTQAGSRADHPALPNPWLAGQLKREWRGKTPTPALGGENLQWGTYSPCLSQEPRQSPSQGGGRAREISLAPSSRGWKSLPLTAGNGASPSPLEHSPGLHSILGC